jgi:hypothetical protein
VRPVPNPEPRSDGAEQRGPPGRLVQSNEDHKFFRFRLLWVLPVSDNQAREDPEGWYQRAYAAMLDKSRRPTTLRPGSGRRRRSGTSESEQTTKRRSETTDGPSVSAMAEGELKEV